ncbi:hypothetical protein MSG28_008194 [Choristoneura fumiferana]|uniref:Uncharacterized protein n=1 Tax=Choristoneura fumiferana TaxID=7141 RepID=A0ACC0JAB2_CHOFU|nr:hypothetical protein MSG28_008194 [Choristoneura fumiferana]
MRSNFHHYMDREQGFEYRPLSIKQKKLLQWQPSDVDLQSTGQRVSRSSVHDRQRHNAIFTTSRFGKPVLEIGPYRYNRRSDSKGIRGAWTCGKASMGCRARVITVDQHEGTLGHSATIIGVVPKTKLNTLMTTVSYIYYVDGDECYRE